MNDKTTTLFVLLVLFIKNTIGIPSNSYHLIDIATDSSLNTSYCSNILLNKNLYRIPNECYKHILCDPHYCDDKSFRCIKIRETLCCLYKYIENNCPKENLKDQFRSIYFHISIEHGYCEINLERIEQSDESYCIANYIESTPSSSTRLSLRHFQWHHLRITTQLPNINYFRHNITNISSKFSFIYTNFIIVLLSMSL